MKDKYLEEFGYKKVRSYNPYWDENRITFLDPYGYRVVIQNASWKNSWHEIF